MYVSTRQRSFSAKLDAKNRAFTCQPLHRTIDHNYLCPGSCRQGKLLGSLMLEHSLLAASSDLSSMSTASTTTSEVPAVTWARRPHCPVGSPMVPSARLSSVAPQPAAVPFMRPRAPSISLSGPYPRSQAPDPAVRCAVTEPVMLPGLRGSGSHAMSSGGEGFFVGPAVHAAARVASTAASSGMVAAPWPWPMNEPGLARKRTRAEAHANQAQEAAAQELMAPIGNPLLAGPQASAGMLAQGLRQQPGAQHMVRPLLASQMLPGLQAWASWPAGMALAARKVGRMSSFSASWQQGNGQSGSTASAEPSSSPRLCFSWSASLE